MESALKTDSITPSATEEGAFYEKIFSQQDISGIFRCLSVGNML